ncbi:Gp41 [Mycobacteroides abscessus subsp. abscessus]|uniref:type II toxin-antitoxin system RelE family toxin n=1 Tax=Mycobacteroides abscessus TaxID=36809 RepID=UPI00092C6C3B|nr:type II toxin-antitoxin system RelE/ParE family toxin [Mycobacteroides abscessus]SIC55892.1 Gp41 [Mycobacteroides abscessus subsp. abscessus]SKU57970.1 Gp41 [Mycobacteroides abscessus subsp. abscessus]
MRKVEISTGAVKELTRIKRADGKLHGQIIDAIKTLATTPRPDGCTKLTGRDAYRVRVRDYRVLYTVNDGELVVLVVKVGKRGSVYE